MVVKKDAWSIAQTVVDELPPYLKDDELTVARFRERNKEKLSSKVARDILDHLAEAGQLERQERRQKGKSGSRIFVYIATGKQ